MSNQSISLQVPSKKKRGAQPGNTNALRHGFYARELGRLDPCSLDEREMRNLLGEAAMLKDYMYYLYNSQVDKTDRHEIAETLRSLSMAGVALARLLQVHSRIRIIPDNSESGISSVLNRYLASIEEATQDIP